MKIETDRLMITDLTTDMAEAISANSLDEDTRKFIPDEVFETPEDALETIEYLMSVAGDFDEPQIHPVIRKADGANLGYVELVPVDDYGFEIGYHIAKQYTGNGYATEAVKAFIPEIAKEAGFSKIYGICLKENSASVRVLSKCGFETLFEGVGPYQGEDREIVMTVYKN